jgi:heat shock protein HtpX
MGIRPEGGEPCIGAGLPMPRTWVLEDSAPNAFATGRDPAHSHVVVTRGLLDKLEPAELEGVLAHELSHIGNYDIRVMTVVTVLVGVTALLSDILLRLTIWGSGSRRGSRDKGGGLALILVLVAALAAIIAPIVAQVIKFAVSRRREYLADASGALLCRNPEALARALEKIAGDQEPLEAANKATAHLYIENPLKEHASMLNNLFSTHPPVEERIRLLRSM